MFCQAHLLLTHVSFRLLGRPFLIHNSFEVAEKGRPSKQVASKAFLSTHLPVPMAVALSIVGGQVL